MRLFEETECTNDHLVGRDVYDKGLRGVTTSLWKVKRGMNLGYDDTLTSSRATLLEAPFLVVDTPFMRLRTRVPTSTIFSPSPRMAFCALRLRKLINVAAPKSSAFRGRRLAYVARSVLRYTTANRQCGFQIHEQQASRTCSNHEGERKLEEASWKSNRLEM